MKALMMKKMRGVTVINLMIAAIVIVFTIAIAVNLVPPYMHNYAIKDALNELAANPDITQMSKTKLRDLFVRKLQVNYITNVSPDALVIVKKEGATYLSMKYEVRVHLIANIDAVILFDEEAKVGESAKS
ncbi:MAG: DUF4845 domain-containing protein [Proteobacteria bacterium]|nr:DUF4845 domain-containing protein [Pseudomonadota bacterium]